MDGDSQLYLDDFALGDRFRSPGHTLGEAHFLLFAGLTGDNHPIHYDEDYARQTRFGARVAHGLLVMAMSALGASPLAQRLETSMIAFLEQGCRFRKPVLLGDTVHAEFEVAGLERKGDKGVLRLRMLRQIPLRRRGDVPHEALLLDGAVSRRFDGWVGANVAWAAVAEPPHRWRPPLRLPSCAGEPCLATS